MKNQSTNHAATVTTFGGFVLPDHNTNGEITMPLNWPEVAKAIDNIAELKVVQMVLWVTWGNEQADDRMPLSIDDFVEVTGLCRRSVDNGIKKAIEHGYINRQNCSGESNLYYYGINLAIPQTQDLPDGVDEPMQILPDEKFALMDESAFEALSDENANFASSSRELELSTQSNNYMDVSRIQEEVNNLDTDKNMLPCSRLQQLSREDNATLCNRVESFSSDLGDLEHTAPNIGQTRRILGQYLASGGDFETFLSLMYDAKDTARRKTNMRRPNRMPYFFACLKRACKESRERVAA